MLNTLVLALLLTAVAAGPVPGKWLPSRGNDRQMYYTLPLADYPAVPYTYPLVGNRPVPLAPSPQPYVSVPAVEQVSMPFGTILNRNPEDQVKVVLDVPTRIPPGTTITVTVNVSQPGTGGTVVSVSNPVLISQAPVAQPPSDAIVVEDAKPASPGQLPDEFDNREPPIIVSVPFENPKDSDVLIALQQEALQNQLLGLAKKTA